MMNIRRFCCAATLACSTTVLSRTTCVTLMNTVPICSYESVQCSSGCRPGQPRLPRRKLRQVPMMPSQGPAGHRRSEPVMPAGTPAESHPSGGHGCADGVDDGCLPVHQVENLAGRVRFVQKCDDDGGDVVACHGITFDVGSQGHLSRAGVVGQPPRTQD